MPARPDKYYYFNFLEGTLPKEVTPFADETPFNQQIKFSNKEFVNATDFIKKYQSEFSSLGVDLNDGEEPNIWEEFAPAGVIIAFRIPDGIFGPDFPTHTYIMNTYDCISGTREAALFKQCLLYIKTVNKIK